MGAGVRCLSLNHRGHCETKNLEMRGPTQRSLNLLRSQGYVVYIVESYNAYSKRRNDLFGFIDIAAIHPDKRGVLGVQTTTGSNLAARISKAEALPAYHTWLAAGNAVEFHGWRKLKTGKKQRTWQPNILRIDISEFL